TGESRPLLARGRFPEVNALPSAARHQSAVRGKGDRPAIAVVQDASAPGRRLVDPQELFTGGGMPETDRAVAARRGNQSAVGRVGDTFNFAVVAGHGLYFRAVGEVPQAKRRILSARN